MIHKVIPWYNLQRIFKNTKLIFLWVSDPIFKVPTMCTVISPNPTTTYHRENPRVFFLQMRTEAQRGKVTCPESHSNDTVQMGRNTRIV